MNVVKGDMFKCSVCGKRVSKEEEWMYFDDVNCSWMHEGCATDEQKTNLEKVHIVSFLVGAAYFGIKVLEVSQEIGVN